MTETVDVPLGQAFDMASAWMRRASEGGDAFLQRFSAIVQEAMPQRAKLETRRSGLFGPKVVVGVTVDMGESVFHLRLERNGELAFLLETKVHNVVLGTKNLDGASWHERLHGFIAKEAELAKRFLAVAEGR